MTTTTTSTTTLLHPQPTIAWPIRPQTTTRKQRLDNLLSLPIPPCASPEWKHEYYQLTWTLRETLDREPLTPRHRWTRDLVAEAIRELHAISDPTDSPAVASRPDHALWTDVMVRRVIADALWEGAEDVSFYDCCEILKAGRSKAAAARLFAQARSSWSTITQCDIGTAFSLV
jgi:hypothetical protein